MKQYTKPLVICLAIFLVLSIIFRITEPFFLFLCRDKDEGMPPRKQEPVYTPPQEPWDNKEYL